MLIMDYPSIRGEEIPDYAKTSTWNLLYAYIDEHSQRLTDECTGYVVKYISRLQSQCVNITFDDQIRYNRMFNQVVHKRGESLINLIKYFKMIRLWKFQWDIAILKIS